MAVTNIAVSGLESYQPAVDYKRSGRIGILSGRNFAWDASGVYSAYASRLVAAKKSIAMAPDIAQTLDLEDMINVAVEDKIWRLNPSSPGSPVGMWEQVYDAAPIVNGNLTQIPYDYKRWSTAYLGGKKYMCAYNYGVFRVTGNNGGALVHTRLTQALVPGFPDNNDPVIAIAETNGRMCYVTRTSFIWSAPAVPENLVPALGGAGFQIIAERIGGQVIALTPVSVGAIIWTTVGALVAEFIGGDTVFRFWQLSTNALPVTSYGITRMPDDDYVVLTRLGLFMFNNLSQPQAITPLFNEFLREFMRQRVNAKGHVWYSITDNRIYVSFREPYGLFETTFALDVVLDRWGIYSEAHLGMVNYGLDRGQLAIVNADGVASFLLSSTDARKNREDPNVPGTYIGLGSNIVIGWMRAENLLNHADLVQELQEVMVNRVTPFDVVQVTYFDEGRITEWDNASAFDEGLITDLANTFFDEGNILEQDAAINYRLEWLTDMFREAFETEAESVVVPMLAQQGRFSDLWVGLSPANFHRLRFTATEPDEFYRVNSLDMTVSYMGNIS